MKEFIYDNYFHNHGHHEDINPIDLAQISGATSYANLYTRLQKHMQDKVKHITKEERDAWNKAVEDIASIKGDSEYGTNEFVTKDELDERIANIDVDLLIPTKVSDLDNDVPYATQGSVDTVYSNITRTIASTYVTKSEFEDRISVTTHPIILEINLGESSTAFANVDDFQTVHAAMLTGTPINFCVRINYTSGAKFVYYPICVKANYISLGNNAGTAELHVNNDGTFTKSGANLW